MKKLKLVFLFTIVLTVSIAANAQEKGDMAVGGNVVLGTGEGYSRGGVGTKFLYNASNRIRVAVGLDAYLKETEFEKHNNINVYVHLLPKRNRDVKVYPLIGIGVEGSERKRYINHGTEIKKVIRYDKAFLYGCGMDCKISDKLTFNTELRIEQTTLFRLKPYHGIYDYGTINLAVGLVYKL